MASFTAAGNTLVLDVTDKGETVAISISGTYDQTIEFQREQGSLGSGAFVTLQTFDTENQTETVDYITQSYNERIRLFLAVDGGGTATVTLTETSNLDVKTFKDRVQNSLMTLTQKFVKHHGGIVRTSASVVTVTAATTLTEVAHAGRTLVVNSAAGVAITTPEATGTGNVYTVFCGTTVTSSNMTIVAPSSATSFLGGVSISTDIAGVSIICNAADDTVSMSGSTTGGVKGSFVRLTDVASGIFMIEGFLCATGSEADPFSAAV